MFAAGVLTLTRPRLTFTPGDVDEFRGVQFDLSDLAELVEHSRAVTSERWPAGHDGAVRRSTDPARWAEALTSGICVGYRRYDGSIAAAASLRPSTPTVHAYGNFVAAGGVGLGARLLQHRIEIGRELGADAITVDVLDWNLRSQLMIERAGFRWERCWESQWEPGRMIHGYRLTYELRR